jgi:hypothetical protein
VDLFEKRPRLCQIRRSFFEVFDSRLLVHL